MGSSDVKDKLQWHWGDSSGSPGEDLKMTASPCAPGGGGCKNSNRKHLEAESLHGGGGGGRGGQGGQWGQKDGVWPQFSAPVRKSQGRCSETLKPEPLLCMGGSTTRTTQKDLFIEPRLSSLAG